MATVSLPRWPFTLDAAAGKIRCIDAEAIVARASGEEIDAGAAIEQITRTVVDDQPVVAVAAVELATSSAADNPPDQCVMAETTIEHVSRVSK